MSAEPSREAPLRVLHVYSGNLYGGIETFLRTLAEERAKCPEMEPEFALCFEGRLADEIRQSGAPLHMLGGVRMSRPWTVLRAQRKLRVLLSVRAPDVVILHAPWSFTLFAAAVRKSRARLVFYRHDIGGAQQWLNVLAGRYEPDLVIANSKFTALHGFPKFTAPSEVLSYVVQIPPTISTDVRRQLRHNLKAASDEVVILQASRMQPWKGQRLLAEALSRLPRELKWSCWFAGDAQRDTERAYVDDIRTLVDRNGIQARVHFLGQRRDVPSLMQAADIFCQPNLEPEPFGIVFVEALASGKPVVTTNRAGGALEIVDDRCALVTSDESLALAEALQALIQDVGQRTLLSANATVRAKEFTDTSKTLQILSTSLRGIKSKRSAPFLGWV